MKKRFMAIFLALVMALTLLPISAFAEDGDIVVSGECGVEGDNVTWTLDSEGTLTISGEGAMNDNRPWTDYRANIKTVQINNGVTTIGYRAFNGCQSLSRVIIPSSVTGMRYGDFDNGTFGNCPLLTSAGPVGGNYSIQYAWTEEIPSYAFCSCTALTSAVIPEGITKIGQMAFYNCRSLDSVIIPSSATQFEGDVFWCTELTSAGPIGGDYDIQFGWTTEIPDRAFDSCPLKNVMIPRGITSIGAEAFMGCNALTEVVIPNGVTNIGTYAFEGCSALTSIIIPNSVTQVGSGAFYTMSPFLTSAGPINGDYDIQFGWTEKIPSYAFDGCTALTSLVIPDGITTIGEGAFRACHSLPSIIIPSSVTYFPIEFTSPYQRCENLTSAGPIGGDYDIQFGWTEKIPNNAFEWYDNLTSVVIPNGVTKIGDGAFSCARSLTNVTIPASTVSIGQLAFNQCDSITDVYYGGSKTQWSKISGKSDLVSDTITIHYALADIMYENGGGTGATSSAIIEKNNPLTLPVCGFTAPAGKEFKAWQIDREEYAPGSSYTVTDDITITAIWKDIDAPITPPEASDKYTVSYDANGGTGTMADTLVGASEVYTFPACGFTAPTGKEFKAWQIGNTEYNPSDVYTVTADTTVTAVWQTIPPVEYTLTGTITGHKGVTYTSVTAQLVGLNGSTYSAEVGKGVADNTGKTDYSYAVTAPAGQYTLEVEARTDKGGIVNRTAVVKLTGNGQTKDINLPNGQAKVKVENKIKTAALVGGLDELIIDADGEVTGEVTLTIENADKSSPGAAAIQSTASGQTLEFMDISITKSESGVESAVTDTGDITVEIVLAFDRTGKSNIAVYRYHDGSVDRLTTQASGSGEKIEVDDDSIAIYAKKFSVYAIGYTVSATDPVTPSNPTTPSRPGSGSSSIGSNSYSISIPTSIIGGAVTVQPTSASTGSKVTITATPNSGYELDTLTVTDASGNRVSLTNQGNNQYTFTMPSGKVTVDAVFSKTWSNPFTDVATSAWYYDAVKFVNQNGLMNGVGNGLFAPGTHLSRAMLAEILYNKEGRPIVTTASSFSDVVAGAWYANAVTWAATKNIVGGYGNGLFGPGDDITREQFAVILYRYAGSPVPPNLLLDFTDAYKVSDWAQDAIRWAVDQGILNGKGNGILDPTGKATRAEAAQMLKNYLEK